jgi:hypothetical protein
MDVNLDSAPKTITPELALTLATADTFGAFLYVWRGNDPNGVWGVSADHFDAG